MGNSCSSRSNRVVDIQVARQHNVTSNSPVASHGSHRSLSLQQEDSGGSHTSSSHRDAERNNVGTSIQSLQGHVKLVGEFTAPIETIDRALSAFSIRSFYDKRNEKITTDRATSAIKFSTGSSENLQHTSTDEPITNSANKGDGYPENSFEMVIRLMRELENVIESMGGTGHGFKQKLKSCKNHNGARFRWPSNVWVAMLRINSKRNDIVHQPQHDDMTAYERLNFIRDFEIIRAGMTQELSFMKTVGLYQFGSH